MKLIRLKHDKKTNYYNVKHTQKLELSFLRDVGHTTVITFRNLVVPMTKKKEYTVNGVSRYLFDDIDDVLLYNVQSDSPLYAQIFWDVAHQVKISGMIYLVEIYDTDCLIEKSYFKDAFQEVETASNYIRAFQKKSPLIIEADRGLDEWTFCIPVGPEKPLFLNKCVERILELDIPNKEIILCGMPHKDFRFFDKVRIVGEDIPAPPVHITRKKNTLARAATLKNLCIIHDRVMLPKNFVQAMESFGDDFPLTGLQSFFFADKKNLIPRRYSDFGTTSEDITKIFNLHAMTKKEMRLIGRKGLFCQNPMRKTYGCDYLTGSLYICKTKLWNYCPQNELLYWDDFEDIEHNIRAACLGIPVIINPYSMTQSMNNRSIMHYYGYYSVFSYKGKLSQRRAITEALPFLRRKPLFRITIQEAKRKLFRIAKKYAAEDKVFHVINRQSFSGQSRLKTIIMVIKSIKIPLWEVEQFVADFEKDVLCESIPPLYRSDLIDTLKSSISATDKKTALITMPFLQNQVSHTIIHSPFMENKHDWFIRKTVLQKLCNKLSAFQMKYCMNGVYFKLSVQEITALIEGTTVYKNENDK
ncbi:MAG: hypothetical protein ACR5LG_07785 [Sodalis sp. (in: enterobacteria)]|uniref:hypothetical protein n=1 Tax=Sodalis sp. (in: enterobacteria) TaxID=1898979 RepID=UPI003F384247